MVLSSGGLGCFWSWRVLLHILVLRTASAGYLFLLVAGGVEFSAWGRVHDKEMRFKRSFDEYIRYMQDMEAEFV